MVTRWFRHVRNIGYNQRRRTLSFYFLGRIKKRGDLVQAFKIVTGQIEIPGFRRALSQIRWNETRKENGKVITKERVNADLRSKSLAAGVVAHWNKLTEEAVEVVPVSEFDGWVDKNGNPFQE